MTTDFLKANSVLRSLFLQPIIPPNSLFSSSRKHSVIRCHLSLIVLPTSWAHQKKSRQASIPQERITNNGLSGHPMNLPRFLLPKCHLLGSSVEHLSSANCLAHCSPFSKVQMSVSLQIIPWTLLHEKWLKLGQLVPSEVGNSAHKA